MVERFANRLKPAILNVKDTPKLLMDFGVWFPRWIFFWWIFLRGFFRAIFLGKQAGKNPPTNPRFSSKLFDQNPVRKFLT